MNASVEQRFWSKVNKHGSKVKKKAVRVHPDIRGIRCWEWTACLRGGYGAFRIGDDTVVYAHRYSYLLANGRHSLDGLGPDGKHWKVLHKCDNERCVNPLHLFRGTYKDNSDDKVAKGRQSHAAPINHARGKACHSVRGKAWHTSHNSPARGEAKHASSLTDAKVIKIRRLYATGRYSQQDLGDKYSISRRAIGNIVNRKAWVHI